MMGFRAQVLLALAVGITLVAPLLTIDAMWGCRFCGTAFHLGAIAMFFAGFVALYVFVILRLWAWWSYRNPRSRLRGLLGSAKNHELKAQFAGHPMAAWFHWVDEEGNDLDARN
jgi:hypothetical protein